MAAPLDVSPVEATAASEAALAGTGQIEGRSLGQIAWRRLRRDKVAMGGGVVVILLVLSAVLAPLLTKYFGAPPDQYNPNTVDPSLPIPLGGFGGTRAWRPPHVGPDPRPDPAIPNPSRPPDPQPIAPPAHLPFVVTPAVFCHR